MFITKQDSRQPWKVAIPQHFQGQPQPVFQLLLLTCCCMDAAEEVLSLASGWLLLLPLLLLLKQTTKAGQCLWTSLHEQRSQTSLRTGAHKHLCFCCFSLVCFCFFAFIFLRFFVYFWFYFSFVFVFVCFLLCFYFLVLCLLWFLCQDKCRRSDWPSAQYFCQKLILAIKCKSQLDALHSSGLRNGRDP